MFRINKFHIIFIIFLLSVNSNAMEMPLGTLVHDGPVTPEQISLYLPVTGEFKMTATATVRYQPASNAKWIAAHPLYRIRPDNSVGKRKPANAFAGVITGLSPGTVYLVEVTVKLGKQKNVQKISIETRSLPETAPEVTRNITSSSTSKQIQEIFDRAVPGDVIQFENGTYSVDGLNFNRSGSIKHPVYIRGASRQGVIIKDNTQKILQLNASNVVLENLTLQASGADRMQMDASIGITLGNNIERVTLRNVTIKGVDRGILSSSNSKQILVYDCTLTGNNRWKEEFIKSKITWNDDGIRVPGMGNAVFNNTLSGFGDALAMHQGVENVGIHFYRNDIRMTGDDAFEADYGVRNITYYDNRTHNAMTHISVDPIYGGPLFVFRNIAINVGRGPYKLNSRNSGFFLYNNTVVRTRSFKHYAKWGWLQHNNGPLVAWGYRNNILIFYGGEKAFNMGAPGHNPVDFDHNGWYPDEGFSWPGGRNSFRTLDEAQYKIKPTQPVFGSSTQRHEDDLISEANPFSAKIKLGNDYLQEITSYYTPELSDKSKLRNAGGIIPGVTDGFSGKAPDIGAIITGRPAPLRGDRNINNVQ